MDTAVGKRGWLLGVWLIFMALANLWTGYRYLETILDYVSHSDPRFTGTLQWALPLLTALALINIVAVILLWFWRKAGFYLFVATSIVALAVNLMLGVPILASLLGLGGLLILWYLLQSRWAYFS